MFHQKIVDLLGLGILGGGNSYLKISSLFMWEREYGEIDKYARSPD